jgi:hypothetical protein
MIETAAKSHRFQSVYAVDHNTSRSVAQQTTQRMLLLLRTIDLVLDSRIQEMLTTANIGYISYITGPRASIKNFNTLLNRMGNKVIVRHRCCLTFQP